MTRRALTEAMTIYPGFGRRHVTIFTVAPGSSFLDFLFLLEGHTEYSSTLEVLVPPATGFDLLDLFAHILNVLRITNDIPSDISTRLHPLLTSLTTCPAFILRSNLGWTWWLNFVSYL